MTYLYLKAFQSVIIPLVLGYSVTLCIFNNLRLPFRLSLPLAYGLGMGILTHVMLIYGILNIAYSLGRIALALLIIASTFLLLYRRTNLERMDQFELSPSPKLNPGHRVLLILGLGYILYIVCCVFWQTFNIPLKDWDAVSFIAYKAMVFYYEKSLYLHSQLPNASYPLHTSLAETWVAFNLDRWDHIFVKAIFPAYFLSMIFMVYIFLRVWVSRLPAVFGVVLILSSNFLTYHATNGYKDFVVMFYNCSVIMLLMLWQKKQHRGFLLLAALMAGISSFIKNEAALYLVVYYFLFLFMLFLEKDFNFLQKAKKFLTLVIPSLGICSIYQIYRISAGITITTYNTNMGFKINQLDRLPGIVLMFINILLVSAGWNLVWFLFLLSLVQYSKISKCRSLCTIVLSVFSFIGLYAAGLLVSPQYEFFKEVSQFTVLSRVVLHFFPLSALAVILINGTTHEKRVST